MAGGPCVVADFGKTPTVNDILISKRRGVELIRAPKKAGTPRGIGAGSTFKQVKKAYPGLAFQDEGPAVARKRKAALSARKAVIVLMPDYEYGKAAGKRTTRTFAASRTICRLFTDANGGAYKRVSVAGLRKTLDSTPGGLLLALAVSKGEITKVYQVFRS
ncbi:hypothetical protein [Actinocorallia longicatena]|uniref:Uncharacterized protein n=1 Tax=Actinocorallia longicatena TaxID=111803 RepID=A0ABP6Q709_9ACTN